MSAKALVQYSDLRVVASVSQLQVTDVAVVGSQLTVGTTAPRATAQIALPKVAVSYSTLRSVVAYLQASVTEVFLDADPKVIFQEDGITIGELLTLLVNKNPSDSIALQELVGKSLAAAKADAVSVTESIDIFLTTLRNVDETITLSEVVGKSLSRPVTPDSMTMSEQAQIESAPSVADSIGFVDVIVRSLGVSLADASSLADVLSLQTQPNFQDSASLSEAPALLVGRPLADATDGFTDTQTLATGLAKADSVSVADVFSRAVNFNFLFSDAFAIDDLANVDAFDVDSGLTKGNVLSMSDSLSSSLVAINSTVLNASPLNIGTFND